MLSIDCVIPVYCAPVRNKTSGSTQLNDAIYFPTQRYVLTYRSIQSLGLFRAVYTSPLAHLFLFTSPPGRHVPLHFTPWQICSFTLHPLADLFLYTSPPSRSVPLHFTPWQTCSFTLHPLADLFLPMPCRLVWEEFSHAAITARHLLVYIHTTLCRHVLIYS